MKDGTGSPLGSSQVSWLWTGITLQTSIGSLLNPGRRWSDDALDALSRAVSLTLWLDRLGDEPAHEPDDDEYELWERATAVMVAEHESRPARQAVS